MDQDLLRTAILVVSGVILVLAIGVAIYSQRRRTDAFRTIADGMGFSFAPRGDPAFLKRVEHLGFFSQGPGFSRRVRNLVRGRMEGVEVTLLDFSFNVPYRKGAVVRTAVLVEWGHGELPEFTLSPKGLFGAVQAGIGLDGCPEFSRRYLLRSRVQSEAAAVRALFTPGLVGFFEERRGVAVEGRGRQLLYYGASGQIPINRLEILVEEGLEVYRILRQAWRGRE